MKERRLDLDNLKGILIYLVVFAHLLLPVSLKGSGLSYEISTFIYFFHMPFFLFISGMVSNKKENLKEFIRDSFFTYFLFNFSYALFDFYLNKREINFIYPYYSMWFVIVLFIGRIIISLVDEKKIVFAFLISLILSLFSGFSSVDNTFALSRIIGFMPFFLFGYLLKTKDVFKFKDKKRHFYQILPFIMILYVIYVFCESTNLSIINFYVFNKFQNNFEFVLRFILVFVNLLFMLTSFLLMPNRKIPLITKFGEHSFEIFIFHRFITLILEKVFIIDSRRVLFSLVVAFFICLVFSSDIFRKAFRKVFSLLQKKSFYVYFFLGLFILTNEVYFIESLNSEKANSYNNTNIDNNENGLKRTNLSNCIKVSFIGDMLLFEDDLYKAKNSLKNDTILGESSDNLGEFDFSLYFSDVKDLFGDYTFGNFEGVISSDEYVSSNYGDSRELRLSYPVEFAKEVSKNIDFANICSNHMFDLGEEGLENTKKELNNLNLDYSDGSDIKVIDIEGLKVAILSYTYGTNYEGELGRSFLSDENILKDFKDLEELDFDKIISFVHLGTEFSTDINYEQDYYAKLLSSLGTDIIFFDHSHSTLPIKMIGDSLVFFGTGNFCSSFVGNNCDKGAISNVYIDKDSFLIKAISITPIKTVLDKENIAHPVSTYDLGDRDSANYILKNMTSCEFSFILEEYFFNLDLEYISPFIKDSLLLDSKGLIDGNSFFLGDSITYGYKIGIPYYEFIDFNSQNIYNLSGNGWRSDRLLLELKNIDKNILKNYDNFFIAIGVNDVRYFGKDNHLIQNLKEIVDYLPSDKNIYIINPWLILEGDLLSNINIDEENTLFISIKGELEKFCKENDLMFLDLNPYIRENIENSSKYMQDYIHPNLEGIKIYSEALLESIKRSNKEKNSGFREIFLEN